MRAFVTGTDTGVGKTFVTALLARALRNAGLDTVALKPLCSGDRGDANALREACDEELGLEDINPLWFQAPLAPLLAARLENRDVSLAELEKWFRKVSAGRQSVLVEGAGGWHAPVADGKVIADLAVALGLPVIVVTANRLGCINHTLLTIESIRARGLTCRGIILNTISPEFDKAARTNRALLEEFTDVPVLFEITPGQRELTLAVA